MCSCSCLRLSEQDVTYVLIYTHSADAVVGPQEQENRDLLERFRLAHIEMEERTLKLKQAEGLSNSIRLELLSSDTERRHLRDAIGQQEKELQQVRHEDKGADSRQYYGDVSRLTSEMNFHLPVSPSTRRRSRLTRPRFPRWFAGCPD